MVGANTVVRNNDVRGWFESAVTVGKDNATPSTAVNVVHNTVVLVEPIAAVLLDDATGTIVRNNILTTFNPELAAAVDKDWVGTSDAVVEGNIVFGYPAVVGQGVTQGAGNRLAAPGFSSWAFPGLAVGAEAACGGEDTTEAGAADLAGNARGPTVGALQPATGATLPDELHLGLTATSCAPDCDGFGDQSLAAATSRARPGSRIVLHGDSTSPTRFEATSLLVDRPLTITGDPGQAPTDVELFHVGALAGNRGMITVLTADDHAVWFDSGLSDNRSDWAAANDGVINRVAVYSSSHSTVETAFELGHGASLRNSVVWGLFEALATARLEDIEIVGNTFVSDEDQQSPTGLYVADATNILVANNVFDFADATSPQPTVPVRSYRDGPAGVAFTGTFAQNHFYGVDVLSVGGDITVPLPSAAGTNCVEGAVSTVNGDDRCARTTPRFVDRINDDFRPSSDSPLISDGDNSYVNAGETDHLGRPRVEDELDVGAYERVGSDP
jgi:hypothetical protein